MEEIEALWEVRELLMPFLWVEQSGVATAHALEGIRENVLRPRRIYDAVGWTTVALGLASVAVAVAVMLWEERRRRRRRAAGGE